MTTPNWQALASTLLRQVQTGQPTEATEEALAKGTAADLRAALLDDSSKKAFWINVYNAYFQVLAQRNLLPPDIYRRRVVRIAGEDFSLDDIEHGILRKYRYKPALGFLPNPFVGRHIRRQAVQRIDYRIHFALNCGVASCPPIAFYDPARLEQQLELATAAFLSSETAVLPDQGEVHVSRLLWWYLGDFGGYRVIRAMLRQYLRIDTRRWRIRFRAYDYTRRLHHFVPEN